MYAVVVRSQLYLLVAAAQAVQQCLDRGDHQSEDPEALHRAVGAFDALERRADRIADFILRSDVKSPFDAHADRVLACCAAGQFGQTLADLVLHLACPLYRVDISALLASADAEKTRIALEMLCHYAAHGPHDPDLVKLASRILQRRPRALALPPVAYAPMPAARSAS